MEKTTIKDYNNGLETKDSLSKVKAVDVSGNDILVNPGIIAQAGGCGRNTSMIGYRKTNGTELLLGVMGMFLMLCS